MSASGYKRTFQGVCQRVRFAPDSGHKWLCRGMSAYDPKRTLTTLHLGWLLTPLCLPCDPPRASGRGLPAARTSGRERGRMWRRCRLRATFSLCSFSCAVCGAATTGAGDDADAGARRGTGALGGSGALAGAGTFGAATSALPPIVSLLLSRVSADGLSNLS